MDLSARHHKLKAEIHGHDHIDHISLLDAQTFIQAASGSFPAWANEALQGHVSWCSVETLRPDGRLRIHTVDSSVPKELCQLCTKSVECQRQSWKEQAASSYPRTSA